MLVKVLGLFIFTLSTVISAQNEPNNENDIYYYSIKSSYHHHHGKYVAPGDRIGDPLQLSKKPFIFTFKNKYIEYNGTFGFKIEYNDESSGIIDIVAKDDKIVTKKQETGTVYNFDFYRPLSGKGKGKKKYMIGEQVDGDSTTTKYKCWQVNNLTGLVDYHLDCDRENPLPTQSFTLHQSYKQ